MFCFISPSLTVALVQFQTLKKLIIYSDASVRRLILPIAKHSWKVAEEIMTPILLLNVSCSSSSKIVFLSEVCGSSFELFVTLSIGALGYASLSALN